MRKFACICLVLALCFGLSACNEADIVIVPGQSRAESTFPEAGTVAVTVNLSSKKFHTDEACRHAVNIKEENKKIVFYRDATEAIADGFAPCSACAEEYKTTEDING